MKILLRHDLLAVLALQASFGRTNDIQTLCGQHHAATAQVLPVTVVSGFAADTCNARRRQVALMHDGQPAGIGGRYSLKRVYLQTLKLVNVQ